MDGRSQSSLVSAYVLARLQPQHSATEAQGRGPPQAGGGTARSEVTIIHHNDVGAQMLGA